MFVEVSPAHEGLSVAAMLLLAAFAIDRLSSGLTFLAFRPAEEQSAEQQERRGWNRKLFYYVVSSVIVIPLLFVMTDIRLLKAMDMLGDPNSRMASFIDGVLTYLVLIGGGERISSFLGGGGGGRIEEPQPVHLTMNVTTDQDKKTKDAISGAH